MSDDRLDHLDAAEEEELTEDLLEVGEGVVLADLFAPWAFHPGLKPRAHLDLADLDLGAENPIAQDALTVGDPDEVEEELQQLAWEALCRRRKGERDEEGVDGEAGAAGESTGADRGLETAGAPAEGAEADAARLDPGGREVGRAGGGGALRIRLGGPRALPRHLAHPRGVGHLELAAGLDEGHPQANLAHARHRFRKARRDLAAFRARNRYQRQLITLLTAALDHMEEAFTTPEWAGELERWWGLFAAFRRCLDFPEMAGKTARTVLKKLLRMKPKVLLAVAQQGGMGRRIKARRR